MAFPHRPLQRLLLWGACFFAVQAGASEGPDCSRPLTLALHERGLLYSSATGTGIDRDVADELIRRSGCKISVSVMSRARIWQLIESGALDFSLSGISTEARERFASFAWYFSNKYDLLMRNDIGITRIDDFLADRRLTLGVIRGFRYGPGANRFVDRLADEGRVSYSTSHDPLYSVLLDGRVHALIIEPFDHPALGTRDLRAQTVTIAFNDPSVPHGLIMSRRSITPPQQQAWRTLIDRMRADGTMQRIFEKYFAPDLARTMTVF